MENCVIGYLVHYCVPYTGAGEYEIPAGTKFRLYGPMRDDAMYMDIVGDVDSNLFEALKEKEKKAIPQLSTRITGFSFYITEQQMKELSLNFISGSRERCLEIFDKTTRIVYSHEEEYARPPREMTQEELNEMPF